MWHLKSMFYDDLLSLKRLKMPKRNATGGRKKKKPFLERFLTIDIYSGSQKSEVCPMPGLAYALCPMPYAG
jgi:hypothetical protein